MLIQIYISATDAREFLLSIHLASTFAQYINITNP